MIPSYVPPENLQLTNLHLPRRRVILGIEFAIYLVLSFVVSLTHKADGLLMICALLFAATIAHTLFTTLWNFGVLFQLAGLAIMAIGALIYVFFGSASVGLSEGGNVITGIAFIAGLIGFPLYARADFLRIKSLTMRTVIDSWNEAYAYARNLPDTPQTTGLFYVQQVRSVGTRRTVFFGQRLVPTQSKPKTFTAYQSEDIAPDQVVLMDESSTIVNAFSSANVKLLSEIAAGPYSFQKERHKRPITLPPLQPIFKKPERKKTRNNPLGDERPWESI